MEKLEAKKGGKALYIQIKDIYRHKILTGELKPGDKIESEMEIQRLYGVSRITARQAVLDLEKEGMVNRGRGRGTFVIWKPAIQEELDEIRSFTEEMEKHGRKPGTASQKVNLEPMEPRMQAMFQVDEHEKMFCLRRTRTADDIKLVYTVSYFPVGSTGHIQHMNDQDYDQVVFHHVWEEFGAQLPDDDVLQHLNIPKNLPVVTRKRIGFDENNKPVEYTLCFYRSDLYSYSRAA